MSTFSPGLITFVFVVAGILAIVTWIKTKGSFLKAIGVFLGGALIITFIAQPSIMTSSIPALIKKAIDFLLGLF